MDQPTFHLHDFLHEATARIDSGSIMAMVILLKVATLKRAVYVRKWWARPDLNRGPADYEISAASKYNYI